MKLDKESIKENIHRSACFQRVFSGKDGIEALEYFDKWTGYRNDTFKSDPYDNAYEAGRRSVAIFLHNALDGDVDKARARLEKESKNEK